MILIIGSAIILLISNKTHGKVTLLKLTLMNVISIKLIFGAGMTFFIAKKTCVNVMWLKYGIP